MKSMMTAAMAAALLCFSAMGAGAVTYTQVGNTIYGSDGTQYHKDGSTIRGSDGSRYDLRGSAAYGPGGIRYHQEGTGIYGSQGDRYNRIGNKIYHAVHITTPEERKAQEEKDARNDRSQYLPKQVK